MPIDGALVKILRLRKALLMGNILSALKVMQSMRPGRSENKDSLLGCFLDSALGESSIG